jgi:thiosulfate dehydrogenase
MIPRGPGLAVLILAAAPALAGPAPFTPPPPGSEPAGELGDAIRLGENVFRHTGRYAGAYVGNQLNCGNCHLASGRQADSGPLWAAYVLYPQYRAKNRQVVSYEQRLQDCFRYSMNGQPPPAGDPVLLGLEAYSAWLASGAPVGATLQGQGYPRLARPAQAPDYARGQQLYAAGCALCHGADGAGKPGVFPALWGSGSYNWGAGMAGLDLAAGFIQANMPLGRGGSLDGQQAWDLAQYLDSQERAQDPRYTGDAAQTRARFHDTPDSMYGLKVNGRVLGGDAGARP